MIVFLHGAYSASDIFSNFKNDPWDEQLFIDYDCRGNLTKVVTEIRTQILDTTREPVHLVGHSLGGVLAVVLANQVPVKSIVTLASPFGGIGSWWPPKTLGHEIIKLNKQCLLPKVDHRFFVSTGGHNPWFIMMNDGVVTLTSQKAIRDANYIEVPTNHFGILSDPKVLEEIRKFHLTPCL